MSHSAWTTEFRSALAARGITAADLARSVGCSRTTIDEARHGRTLPYHQTVVRMAEALDWPSLESMSIRVRTRKCETCGRDFVDNSSRQYGRHCSKDCRNVALWGRGATRRRADAAVAHRRLDRLLTVIGAHCDGCEPSRVCRDTECALRPYTPHVKGGPELDITPPLFGVSKARVAATHSARYQRAIHCVSNREHMRRKRAEISA